MADDTVRITQVRSLIGSRDDQRRTVRALGLRRIRHTVTQPDRPEIRGMLAKVAHLVEVRYPGADEPVGLEPGQEPKGAGRPPAGPSVDDEAVLDIAEATEEALAETGTTDLGDLVENPPTLETTDTVHKPKPRSVVHEELQEESPPADEAEE